MSDYDYKPEDFLSHLRLAIKDCAEDYRKDRSDYRSQTRYDHLCKAEGELITSILKSFETIEEKV